MSFLSEMILKRLNLINFRHFLKKTFYFDSKQTLVIGPNGSGKTNILEAIYLFSSGESFRAEKNLEMVTWEKPFSILEAEVKRGEENLSLGIKLVVGSGGQVKKEFYLNKIKRTRKIFLGNLLAVAFRPEDMLLISGSPSRRRAFLDFALKRIDWEYYQAISIYSRALLRRNRLLDKIRERKADQKELYFWDQSLVKNGEIIAEKRLEFIDFINNFFNDFSEKQINRLKIDYAPRSISVRNLEKSLEKDLRFGSTSVGPHRDDFLIKGRVNDRIGRLDLWGSRGQQRLAILALKLAELQFIKIKNKEEPILLLDDIFSELDEEAKALAMQIINQHQTIITSAEEDSYMIFGKKDQSVINRMKRLLLR